MAVVQCAKGHYYDDAKFSECPHCKDGLDKVRKETYDDDLEKLKTEMISIAMVNDETTVALQVEAGTASDEGKTIGTYSFENGTELITGWLVCVRGRQRGRDYRIFHGWNRIGRDHSMDICLAEDEKISSKNHAAIVFDDRSSGFYAVNEEGSLTYINGEQLLESREIKTGDRLEMGGSEFIFIAFCTEERKWEEE